MAMSVRSGLFAFSVSFVATGAVAVASATPAATPAPVKCAIPKACALFTNTSSGTALEGMAATGSGLTGISSGGAGTYGISISGLYYEPGVEGESANNDGYDAGGVFGANYLITNVAPEIGALAYGAEYGVAGETESAGTYSAPGYGVFGQDEVGAASNGGDFNAGVLGTSTVGAGVLGEANAIPTSSIHGGAPVGVYGVARAASGTPNPGAWAFFGETNSFGLSIDNPTAGVYVDLLEPGDFIQANHGSAFFYVDTSGNEHVSGTLTTSRGTYVRTTGASGTAMMEYATQATAPQVDDVGESQLVNGRAYVAIDARLGDTIDQRVAYHVFVTPEGDCNGLYVTQKSPAGFAVRELRGGRSSLAFEYRIVAKPLGNDGRRLAIAPPEPNPDDRGDRPRGTSHRVAAAPLSPEERLKRRIGAQAYAEAMLRLRRAAAR